MIQKDLTTLERSKVKRVFIWMFRNNEYDKDENLKLNKVSLLNAIDVIENNKRFTKEDAIVLKFFIYAATRCLRKKGKSFIYDDDILMSAYDKLHDMSLA